MTSSLLYIDIDQLSYANGSLGPVRVEQHLADMLKLVTSVVGEAPTEILGGDGFVVTARDGVDPVALAERVRAETEHKFSALGRRVIAGANAGGVITPSPPVLTVSIGVSRSGSFEAALHACDRAKALGRNRVITEL